MKWNAPGAALKHLRDILLLPLPVTCLIPLAVYRYTPEYIPDYLPVKIMSLSLFCSGVLLFFWSLFHFEKTGKGTLAPWSRKEKLITTGPYRFCRNPMIGGIFLILLAEGLFFRSVPILIWALVFFIINLFFCKFREEPFLEKKFGAEYRKYKSSVPGWWPRI